jgi:hypothetical protein
MLKEYTYTLPVKAGPWRAEAKFPFSIKTVFSIALRDSAGNRVDNGLPDDLVIHVDGNSYPVQAASKIRSDMRYAGRPAGDLDASGGKDAGVISIGIKIPAESAVHFHATWPETLEPGASLTIIAMENK